jgi:hypothetical protein
MQKVLIQKWQKHQQAETRAGQANLGVHARQTSMTMAWYGDKVPDASRLEVGDRQEPEMCIWRSWLSNRISTFVIVFSVATFMQ